jgi:hypothetical protein
MRSHIATTLFAIMAFFAIQTAPAHADEVDQLKNNAIWRHCEHYFLTVEHYKTSEDHYAIKDVSIEFVRTIKRFKPSNDREAFLFSECVNLASGNATHAHEAIQREQEDDRAFFEMARIDAENNSNASRFDYVQQLEDQRDLALDVELAQDTFRNLLEIERSSALNGVLRPFGQLNSSFSSSGGGSIDFGFYNNSAQAPFMALFQFVSLVAHGFQSSGSGGTGGFTTAKGAGSPGTTIAPVTPATATASNTTGPQSGVSAGGASAPAPPAKLPQDAVLERAQHLDSGCASYGVTDADVTLARVTNQCDEPIVFHWCWVPNGRSDCAPNLLSSVISGRQSETIPGPEENEQTVAVYVVCDMSNRQRICLN